MEKGHTNMQNKKRQEENHPWNERNLKNHVRLYVNKYETKFKNLEEMNNFLRKSKLPKLTPLELGSWNRPISIEGMYNRKLLADNYTHTHTHTHTKQTRWFQGEKGKITSIFHSTVKKNRFQMD